MTQTPEEGKKWFRTDCQNCDGSGDAWSDKEQDWVSCPNCQGTGEVEVHYCHECSGVGNASTPIYHMVPVCKKGRV